MDELTDHLGTLSYQTDPEILQKELASLKERYVRIAADFINFRKQVSETSKKRADAEKEIFISELLPILDNLERALEYDEPALMPKLHEGVAMTLNQMVGLLQRHGVRREAPIGMQFDPHRHEAVSVNNDPDRPDNSILDVVQNGYVTEDTVFRPAKVVVNDRSHGMGDGNAR